MTSKENLQHVSSQRRMTKTSAPLHVINSQLNRTEFSMGRTLLESKPGYLTIVLGNGCNIDCPHCYQAKNGDNLLRDKEIGYYLRREFSQFYPYLETLRLQGGEVFALKGFSELVEDIASSVDRPLISISTNGTLLDDAWCKRIVEMPFQSVTFSFDAGTQETFERLRRGAKFDVIVKNVNRLQKYKSDQESWYPNLDAFFVVMRSNFREIPHFMKLMLQLQIYEVSFQTMLVDDRNLQREPQLYNEELVEPEEIRELHGLLQDIVEEYTDLFDVISFSGLQSLFESIGISSDFLNERRHTLIPGLDKTRKQRTSLTPPKRPQHQLPATADNCFKRNIDQGQCLNPWSTLFVTENGDVSLCFLSEPVGNLYSSPLVEIWNGSAAVNKRSEMLAGNFTQSGCSSLWCDWRDSDGAHIKDQDDWHKLLMNFNLLVKKLLHQKTASDETVDTKLKAVRRLMKSKDKRINELESRLQQLWDDNAQLHRKGQQHIHYLEVKIANLEVNQSGLYKVCKGGVSKLRGFEAHLLRRLTGLPRSIMRLTTRLNRKHGEPSEAGSKVPLKRNTNVCIKPFEMLEVHEHGETFLCCPQWQNKPIGVVKSYAALDMWNNRAAQAIRRSVLDGSFEFCDHANCPHLASGTGPVGNLDQLRARGVSSELIHDIEQRRTVLAHGPITLNCCYDRSCNLSCASCRKGLIMYRGRDRAEALSIQHTLRNDAMSDIQHLFISGSGDPFGSPGFREWLRTMSKEECKHLVNIHLHTNAQLLNQRMWDSLSEYARDKINSIEVSIDASTEETYKLNRYPGDWNKLLRNLSFIGQLRARGHLQHVRISMVVQNNNYKEMGDFIQLRNQFNFDQVSFSKLLNWFPGDESDQVNYQERAVHLATHPDHHEFLQTFQSLNLRDQPGCDVGNLTAYLGSE